eukprot:gnl/MRDRNA2_/MRDRNA2_71406_c0_seq1.p1 gnl/MRDRNA2_/MRDRNA2_71406_c0~~gnl/MRDRNA2_/MRDRNA2_71406_c0_seq1.p1  ORF type:complete len:276 (+),score=70.63 gnl/MRDRNA2_/MRDRNA2_71406_c0_seq1:192-1019(+)
MQAWAACIGATVKLYESVADVPKGSIDILVQCDADAAASPSEVAEALRPNGMYLFFKQATGQFMEAWRKPRNTMGTGCASVTYSSAVSSSAFSSWAAHRQPGSSEVESIESHMDVVEGQGRKEAWQAGLQLFGYSMQNLRAEKRPSPLAWAPGLLNRCAALQSQRLWRVVAEGVISGYIIAHAKPQLDSEVVQYLPRGTEIILKNVENGWAQLHELQVAAFFGFKWFAHHDDTHELEDADDEKEVIHVDRTERIAWVLLDGTDLGYGRLMERVES